MLFYYNYKMQLINHFEDGYYPSDTQKFILDKVELALNKNKKFIIISAPTGSGKSFISKTLANYSRNIDNRLIDLVDAHDYNSITENNFIPGGCYCLTITKNLQDQYLNFFNDAYCFKGKNNYQCSYNNELDCDCGACVTVPSIKTKCIFKRACPYYVDRDEILINKFSILNYASFFKLSKPMRKRQFIVCDEASELEDELVNNFSLELKYKELKYFGIDVTPISKNISSTKFQIWVFDLERQVNEELNRHISRMKNIKKELGITTKDASKYKFLMNLSTVITYITGYWNECDYLIDYADELKVNIMPTYVYPLAQYIFNYADTVVLMSATIINHKKFAETLGINDYEYIEAPSSFDPKKAPIYVINGNILNYKNLDYMLPKLNKQINDICNFHKNVKGIIHTHTQKISDYFKTANFNNSRFTIRSKTLTNDEVLEIHKEKENSVIISPSMTFGVDLKDDLARFQIIVKIPWLPLGSERIKKIASKDREWYIMKMFNILIQSCGRGIRTTEDWCNTYILDSSIKQLLIDYQNILPKYFINRFV